MPQVNAWWEDAACRDVDPEIFTPKKFGGGRPRLDGTHKQRDWSEAKAVCDRCPVIDACLKDALATPPPGDAGGTDYLFVAGCTPEQLMELRRRRGQKFWGANR